MAIDCQMHHLFVTILFDYSPANLLQECNLVCDKETDEIVVTQNKLVLTWHVTRKLMKAPYMTGGTIYATTLRSNRQETQHEEGLEMETE